MTNGTLDCYSNAGLQLSWETANRTKTGCPRRSDQWILLDARNLGEKDVCQKTVAPLAIAILRFVGSSTSS